VHVCAKDWLWSMEVVARRFTEWQAATETAASYLADHMKADVVPALVDALAAVAGGFDRKVPAVITVGELASVAGVQFATAGKAVDRWVAAGVLEARTPAGQQRNRAFSLTRTWRWGETDAQAATRDGSPPPSRPSMPGLPSSSPRGQGARKR